MPVSEKLAYEIFYIEFWHILSMLLFIGTNYLITLKARKTPLLYSYLLTQLMLVLWIFAKICKTVSPNIDLRWLFIVVQYFGVSFLGGALFIFAYIYSFKKVPSKRLLILSLLPCVFCFMIVVTNPLHYGFYSKFTFYSDSFGPLFYVNMTITYTYFLISTVMLERGFLKMFGKEKMRAYLFLIGILVPIVINILYVLDIFESLFHHQPLFDYTPIATGISLILFAIAALKYRFLDILPMAGKQIFDNIESPMSAVNRDNRIIAFNKAFLIIYPDSSVGQYFNIESQLTSGGTLLTEGRYYKVIFSHKKNYTFIRLVENTAAEKFFLLLEEKNTEISRQNARLEKLNDKKRKLGEIKAERYVLQELHDILGHATVLAISACEAELLSGAINYTAALSNVCELLNKGENEFKRILLPNDNEKDSASLLIALENLLHTLKSSKLKTELTVQGHFFELGSAATNTIYRICREAITNSLKHSRADSLNIILRYNEDDFEFFVVDNGVGCVKITFGKGLSAMSDWIHTLGGSIQFFSDEHCGFHIHTRLPRR